MSMYHHSSLNWNFDTKGLINKLGKEALNKGNKYDIFKPLRSNRYDEDISNSLTRNIIFAGPKFDAPKNEENDWKNLQYYQIKQNDECICVSLDDKENQKKYNPQLMLYSDWWFKFKSNNKCYFASSTLKKIVPISTFWTKKGQEYILGRRQIYLQIKNKPHIYGGPHQLFPYKTIPSSYEI